ncbi:MAG: methionine--tRNA ligase [Proteobacteria bacterium]|nr:methionine--tRNA ligase [Pseudomonadota bacterium]
MSKFYVTTAIDYPSGLPHIGHLYEKILADTYARWYRLQGDQVYFLTGTDENGQKLQKAARDQGFSSVQEFVDRNAGVFLNLSEQANISYSDFIRTTEPRHQQVVTDVWHKLWDQGDIYQGEYSGSYCYGCEQFISPSQVLHQDGKNICPVHLTELTELSEDGYYFKLSRYQDKILSHLTHHHEFIFPETAYTDILTRLQAEPLKDLPISRKNQGWGIPIPQDQNYVIYTWFDALINYYTPTVSGAMPQHVWPSDVHVIGKDINWFHSVVWPGILMALNLPLPKKIFVHGMILDQDGRKMSKSLGNIICPMELMASFPLDTLRYIFLRSVPSGKDGKVSAQLIARAHNGELANELGNLVSRVIKLALKKNLAVIPPLLMTQLSQTNSEESLALYQPTFIDCCHLLMAQYRHDQVMNHLFAEISELNIGMNRIQPWSLAESEPKLQAVLYTLIIRIYLFAYFLQAFLPDTATRIFHVITAKYPQNQNSTTQVKDILAMMTSRQKTQDTSYLPTFYLRSPDPLFRKINLESTSCQAELNAGS